MSTLYPILLLDQLAAQTWPASYVQSMQSWLLRAHPQLPSRRCNSVLTIGEYPAQADWMDEVEAFYELHGLPARFHISASSPPGLDTRLEELGFSKEMESLVMAADLDSVAAKLGGTAPHPYSVAFSGQAVPAWMAAYMAIEQFPEDRQPAYEQMMERIQGVKRFLLVHDPMTDEPVAIGTAILQGEWAGLINVAVNASYRKQGLGQHVVLLLAQESARLGARTLYLQSLASNEAALRLYKNAGFLEVFRYHYRTAPPRLT